MPGFGFHSCSQPPSIAGHDISLRSSAKKTEQNSSRANPKAYDSTATWIWSVPKTTHLWKRKLYSTLKLMKPMQLRFRSQKSQPTESPAGAIAYRIIRSRNSQQEESPLLPLLCEKCPIPKVTRKRPTQETVGYADQCTPETLSADRNTAPGPDEGRAPGRRGARQSAYHASPRCW